MPATRKHFFGGVAVCVGVTLSAFSVAWACSPGGGVNVNPGSGAAGTSVLVSGSGYEATAEAAEAGAGPVEIRWNSMSGTRLATASGPSFSTSVIIPSTAGERTRNRTYYIVAVQKLASGQLRTASAPFTVPATEPQSADAQPEPEAQPQPVAQQAPAPAPAPATDDAVAAPSASTGAPAAAKAAPARRTSGRAGSAAARTAPATAGSNTSSASAAPAAQIPEPAPAPAVEPAEVAQLPSGRTLSSDVWSGFSEGATSRGPSLVDPTSSTNGSGDAGLGLGLVALGTVGLLGGAVVGVRSRRRPVAVEASTDSN